MTRQKSGREIAIAIVIALVTSVACGPQTVSSTGGLDADNTPLPDAAVDLPRDGTGGSGGGGTGGTVDAAPDLPAPDTAAADARTPDARTPDTAVDSGPRGPVSYYVDPKGDDMNDGLSAAKPFRTTFKAMVTAQPGDTVNLAEGIYQAPLFTVRAGTPTAPITIRGPATAVIKAVASKVVEIVHDHITIEGVTIDGLHGIATAATGYADVTLYVAGVTTKPSITGVKMLRLTIKNALSECVRIRQDTTKSEIGFSTIGPCGLADYMFGSGSNGEGIYVGTNSAAGMPNDASTENWIHDNTIDTQGNACVDIKEFAGKNLVEKNKCTGQKSSSSGGFFVRSSGNVIRENEILGCAGSGMRIGPTGTTIPATEGLNNDIIANRIHDNTGAGMLFNRAPQGRLCGNVFLNNRGGDVRGTAATGLMPMAACPVPDGGLPDTLPDADPADGGAGDGGTDLPPTDAAPADGAGDDATSDGAANDTSAGG